MKDLMPEFEFHALLYKEINMLLGSNTVYLGRVKFGGH